MSLKAPPLSLKIINDALEYHGEIIVRGTEEGNAVHDHWSSMRYLWKVSANQQLYSGRIYHRVRLAELVYYACVQHPYGALEPESESQKGDEEEQHSMVHWTAKEWEALKKKLLRLLHSIKRQDANCIVRRVQDERPMEHPRAKDKALFGMNVKKNHQLGLL